MNKIIVLLACGSLILGITSCSKGKTKGGTSNTTGWSFNDTKNGGFEKLDFKGQATGPGLVLIPGGTFMMGQKDQDVMSDWNNVPRRVTVPSFYMDATEVTNHNYLEYLWWLNRVFGESFPQVCQRALPDTNVWRDELAYNEPYVEYYLRHPSFRDYPVVGVSWLQATDFAKWRSDRVNEQILSSQGIIKLSPESDVDENNFTTQTYLAGQYEPTQGDTKKQMKDIKTGGKATRPVRFEDGILLPDYRLPTEAEWEYAAYANAGNQPYKDEERITEQKIYPWNGHSMRYPKNGKLQGKMLSNYKRGRGDNMGIAPNLNDNASPTNPVSSFYPNDFGLYNMAGNVNEWVMDVYRPMTSVDANDFNTFRGNIFKTKLRGDDGELAEKDSLGRINYRDVREDEAAARRNYRSADVRNYSDQDNASNVTYGYGKSSLINDRARVYKGGSWKDRVYWLSPGTRRYYQETEASDEIGFRCAMDRLGSQLGNKFPGGHEFKKGKK